MPLCVVDGRMENYTIILDDIQEGNIQEVIAQSDWQEDSSLVFIITGSGERCAVSYDGDQQNAPVLYIEY